MVQIQTIESSNKEIQDFVGEHIRKGLPVKMDAGAVEKYFDKEMAATKEKINTKLLALDPYKKDFAELETTINGLTKDLDKCTDLGIGVIRTISTTEEGIAFVGNEATAKNPVTLRDARLQRLYEGKKAKAEDVPETSVTIAAGTLRGVLQIVKDSDGDAQDKAKAKIEAVELFKSYQEKVMSSTSQKDRNEIIHQMNYEMITSSQV
ncbi:MAG UNVERIFIED_CONTAM: hypothetical protein LVQ98_09430 [Rickettsiaceae bacterium]|jgi:hypothetical protein